VRTDFEEVRMKGRTKHEEWSARVLEWRRSGQTSKEYAAEAGVKASTLLWWSTRLNRERAGERLRRSARSGGTEPSGRREPWPIVELSGGGGVDERFELELSLGRRLRIPPGFDAEALSRLLAVLQ